MTDFVFLILFGLILLFRREALGDFTSPADGAVLYKREFTTIEIPWKFNYGKTFGSVTWFYKKVGSSDPGHGAVIYVVDSQGTVVAGQATTNQFADRIEFKGDLANQDATLAIKDFMKRDEGDFTCEVRGGRSFHRLVTIKATVLSNVTEFKIIGNNNNETVQGDNITLSCTTTMGEPSPRVEIRKGSTAINSTTASSTSETTLFYHFGRISKDDSDTYSCQVTTDGITSAKTLQLDVKYPPEIDRTSVKTEQFGCLEKLISIDCEASGKPDPVINIIGPDGNSLKREFVLKKFGTYRCEARSRLGNDSLNITVSLAKDKPEKPSFSGECRFTRLIWRKSRDKSVKYTLQVREEGSSDAWGDIITSIDTSYSPSTNSSFSKDKSYEFRVVAKNCVGDTENEGCIVKGEAPPTEKRSADDGAGSNAVLIAGVVIAVLIAGVVIAVLVIILR